LGIEASTIGSDESQCAVVERLNLDAAFVHEPVMEATQEQEVAQFRLAAVRPVMNVVAVDISVCAGSPENDSLCPGH
jgi:hypothetical protein